jgi:hypothetical protein
MRPGAELASIGARIAREANRVFERVSFDAPGSFEV